MPPHRIPFPVALSNTDEVRGVGLQQNCGRSVATGAKNTVGDTVFGGECDGVRVKSPKCYNEIIE